MIEGQHTGIIAKHISHFLFSKTCHLIKPWAKRVVGANVEATCKVVHSNRTYTRHKHSAKSTISKTLYGVEETAKITLAMRLLAIAHEILQQWLNIMLQ